MHTHTFYRSSLSLSLSYTPEHTEHFTEVLRHIRGVFHGQDLAVKEDIAAPPPQKKIKLAPKHTVAQQPVATSRSCLERRHCCPPSYNTVQLYLYYHATLLAPPPFCTSVSYLKEDACCPPQNKKSINTVQLYLYYHATLLVLTSASYLKERRLLPPPK